MDCRHAPLKLEQSLVPERFSSFSSFGEDHQARTSSRKMNRSRRIDNSGFLILVDVLNLDILSDLEIFFSFFGNISVEKFFQNFLTSKNTDATLPCSQILLRPDCKRSRNFQKRVAKNRFHL